MITRTHLWKLACSVGRNGLGLVAALVLSGEMVAAAPKEAKLKKQETLDRNAKPGDYVVIIHGLGWLRDPLKPTVKHLSAEGYQTVRFSYDSRKALNTDGLTEEIDALIKVQCTDLTKRVHFVAHSMGCIVTRCYLHARQPKKLGRVVFLAPPNQGTELADLVAKSRVLQKLFGTAASALGTTGECLPQCIPAPTYGPGVIMGSRSMFPPLSWMLDGPDDGVIRVDRGKLEGMGGFVVVPATHTRIPGSATALRQIDSFLTAGTFIE